MSLSCTGKYTYFWCFLLTMIKIKFYCNPYVSFLQQGYLEEIAFVTFSIYTCFLYRLIFEVSIKCPITYGYTFKDVK